MSSVLQLQNIVIKDLFSNINISLTEKEIYSVIGYSGSGKSMLLRIAAGLLEPDEGTVLLREESLYDLSHSHRLKRMQRFGFVFQNDALISNINLFDNLALPLRYHSKLKEKEILEKITETLAAYNLSKEIYSMPSSMSLGERKIAAFARAVINEPDVLFLDEPTAMLDKKTAQFIADIIESFKENKKTIFMTSNDMDLIFNLSDKVGVLINSSINLEGYPYDIKYSNNKEIKELLSSIKTGQEEEVENEILQLLK